MIKVFLDDIRIPKMSHNETKGLGMQYSNTKDWVIIRDYFDFINFVDNNFDKIDFFSLDVEGYEMEVLKGIDFTKHTPTFILIEIYEK